MWRTLDKLFHVDIPFMSVEDKKKFHQLTTDWYENYEMDAM